MDVNSAFLYGTLDRCIYIKLPDGSKEPSKGCKLRKCIYGMKQSPLVWYEALSNSLTAHGFALINFDLCVFVHLEKPVYLSVHIDDIMLFGNDPKIISEVENILHSDFECTDLGTAHDLFAIGIE
jgi:hypothetical protein